VFHADNEEVEIQSRLQTALEAHVGRPFGVLLRSAAEMAAVLASNPFSTGAPNLVHTTFLKGAVPRDVLAGVSGPADEEIAPGLGGIYVYYPQGQGGSKLKLSAAGAGTARNINTIAKLVEMTGHCPGPGDPPARSIGSSRRSLAPRVRTRSKPQISLAAR
jgi:uncharacterized protein (DUF1697 family)